ncbi:hypothetical protein E4T39_08168 [Aureobasidium subglaciale]|nr:hypothetical protein E4T39_08168 [Aureobasidium subglaciale]
MQSIAYASENFEDVKTVIGDLKEAFCKLSGSETIADCVKNPVSKLSNGYEMVGSVFSSPFGSAQTGSSRASPPPPAVRSRTSPYAQPSTSSSAEGVIHSFEDSLTHGLGSTVKSKYTSAESGLSSVELQIFSAGSTIHSNVHSVLEQLISPDDHITTSSSASLLLKNLELQYDLTFAKTYLHLLRTNDSSIKAHTERAGRQLWLGVNKLR